MRIAQKCTESNKNEQYVKGKFYEQKKRKRNRIEGGDPKVSNPQKGAGEFNQTKFRYPPKFDKLQPKVMLEYKM